MKKLKKKLLIFDVDGVLIDSKKNMELSWKKVQHEHSLYKISFENYFKHVGKPFFVILKLIGVKTNYEKIRKTYQIESIKHQNKIRYYDKTIETLKKLKKKNYNLNIVTSKDFYRTKKFLGKNINLFNKIECDNKRTKGKPHPDKINKIIRQLKFEKEDCIYIGDTNIDYLTAKNSNIDFVFAEWGYGNKFSYKYKCKKIISLLKIL